jgi:predicted ATP-grasp superfamily ATP-dependent carboligase
MQRWGKNIKNAIVIATHSIGYGIIRSLGEMGVPIIAMYYSDKDMGYVSKYVKKAYKVPHPEKKYIQFNEFMNKYKNKYRDDIIFPSDDVSLTAVSKSKDFLKNYYKVACPSWDITKKIIDKKYTYQIANDFGVPSPATYTVSNFEQYEKIKNKLKYPCLVKPRKSHIFYEKFKKKLFMAHSENNIFEYLKVTNEFNIDMLIQEYIPGPDTNGVNYNSFVNYEGQRIEFTSKKCRLAYPGFGIPRCVISKNIPEILPIGRKIISVMKYKGYSCTEFKMDERDGQYKLMEINARHNRSGLLSLKSGINFPYIEYMALSGKKINSLPSFKEGCYWIDEFHDFYSTLKYYKKEKYKIKNYFKPYFNDNIFSIFNKADIQPFIKRLAQILLK